eukprot:TRINITY_DN4726_c2_g1_i1.p1 TRINITY_DN4726_c2_g1~~TRINITY_DN4726_c2_g1_i1.p1  ORF type:complete len:2038 (+),score=434.30 TRINITY_DN4726_c2_g1_i1:75-6188(+)
MIKSFVVLLAIVVSLVEGQTCNAWNTCGTGFSLKAGSVGIPCGAAPLVACSDAVCCDATCDNAGWAGCGVGFTDRAASNTIVCGAGAVSCSTAICCLVTCDNGLWPGCTAGFLPKPVLDGITCGATAASCSTTTCCDVTCDNSGWAGCTTGYRDKAAPAGIRCGGTAAACTFTTCCDAMCNNAAFNCPVGFTAKVNQASLLCGLTTASCSAGTCCDATCDHTGFSCLNFIGAVAKAGQSSIRCGAAVTSCTQNTCCDATCSNPAFACTTGFVARGNQAAITCGATAASCTNAGCCDATCVNGGWASCSAGNVAKVNMATLRCGATAAACTDAICCDATCANTGYTCPTGYNPKANQNSIRCGATAASCNPAICCDTTCDNALFSCGGGYVAKPNQNNIICGPTPASCSSNTCCDATCNNALFTCPVGWQAKSSNSLILCGATAATCTTNLCCDPTLCGANQRVLNHACVACPAGSTNVPTDSAAGADTNCDPTLCGTNEYVASHTCRQCAAGSTNMQDDDATGPDTFCDTTLCLINERVQNNLCVQCLAGSTNAAGDPATGSDTFCEDTLCGVDERVINHACATCAAGSTNTANDNAAGPNTFCDPTACGTNQRVESNACVACPLGMTNLAGDLATGVNTVCDTVICGANQRVVNNQCLQCPLGSTNIAGDQASGSDTFCDPTLCGTNQRVFNHACAACPAGTVNTANDPASGPDTLCNAILCASNQRVLSNACAACPPGSTNAPGDSANGPDTTCDHTICTTNQRVLNHVCLTCPSGSTNLPADDAAGPDTYCDVTYCERNQKVQNHQCIPCANSFRNAPGDDATGPDTSCSRAASVTVTPTGLMTSEAGLVDTFTITLESEPFQDVTIPIHSSDTGEGVVSVASVTFTSSNWGAPQTITVTGVQDATDDGDVTYTIIMGRVVSADTDYNGLDPTNVLVTNIDDDTIGVSVAPITDIITSEAGGVGVFTVALHTQPTADVTINLQSTDETEGTISPSQLVFSPGSSPLGQGHWGAPQLVTVSGVDDMVKDGDIIFTVVTSPTISVDPLYNGINPPDVSAKNLDNDVAGVRMIPLTSLITSESGDTALVSVELLSQPALSVMVNVGASDITEASLSPASMTFTPANWNTPQTFTVTGVDDNVADGDVSYNVTATTQSSESSYSGVVWMARTLINADNDVAGIVVTSDPMLVTAENNSLTPSFSLTLKSAPISTVVIPLVSTDTTEGLPQPNSVQFTAANWNIPVVVNIIGVQDSITDGLTNFAINIGPAQSADDKYDALPVPPVTAYCADDDEAGVIVSPTSGINTSEAGVTAWFTIRLGSQPTHDLTIGLTSSDHTEGEPNVPQVVFQESNWQHIHTVTVKGVQDRIADDDIMYDIITSQVSTLDPVYSNIDPPNVRLYNINDDVASIVVTPTQGLRTSETGSKAYVNVSLTSQPTANVVIRFFSSDTSEGRLDPPEVTFTPGSWEDVRTVTITGVQDAVDDGDMVFKVTSSGAISTDPRYSMLAVPEITVLNAEDDVAGITVTPNPAGVFTSETGNTSFITVVLNTQPTGDVTIPVSSSDVSEGVVSPSTLLFTSGAAMGINHWGIPQTILVTGVDDTEADGNIPYLINFGAVMSTDARYANQRIASVSAWNTDDDEAKVVVNPTTGHTIGESGLFSTFTVVLSAQPTQPVSCGMSVSDQTEATLSATKVTFGTSDWSVLQTVTITGVDDNILDDDVQLSVVMAPCVSADFRFNNVDPPDVQVTNIDMDSSGAYLLVTLSLPTGIATTEDALCKATMSDVSLLWSVPQGYITKCRVAPSSPQEGTTHDVVTFEIHQIGNKLTACETLRGLSDKIRAAPNQVTIAGRTLQESTATVVGCSNVKCTAFGVNQCSSNTLVDDAATKDCLNNVCTAATCCKTQSPSSDDDDGIPWWVWLVVALAALCCFLVVAFLLFKMCGSNTPAENNPAPLREEEPSKEVPLLEDEGRASTKVPYSLYKHEPEYSHPRYGPSIHNRAEGLITPRPNRPSHSFAPPGPPRDYANPLSETYYSAQPIAY